MAIKTIMCVVGVKVGDGDLQTAISLCAENNAQLSVLVVSFASPPPIGDYTSTISDAWLEERTREVQKLAKRAGKVAEVVRTAGISASVHSEYAEFVWTADTIGRYGRYSDLTLIGPEALKSDVLRSKVIEGALFESGRPLLILPAGSAPTLTPKRVLLAWDSRLESARAAREALEMLIGADEVHVTIVDPDTSSMMNGPEPGADVGSYLAHHGVRVIVDRLPSGGNPVADVLNQHAVDINADLIVMGGYGHSRLRERVFGGVTKSMIDVPKFPILMAR
ncbi:universal stress protein [Phyllobacterium brassicacearum]|uniref:Universal stress protein n=1 Tax=Phyllobacterium brassicacearum TaxID=314235 RepID=A0A2P7B961_9HYPH|nr:universal stress protein [Phyllobacterium brassicacearum]PSH63011.1 universal stress protein [Phyllobacterium brassicacearum]TDQ13826.1 nucleotide-binding universal stress UspA family protein [Phyllobacterium brassicacearum]